MKKIDITGKRFGRLLVIRYHGYINKETFWECRCDCGKIKNINSKNLRYNKTISCGCFAKEIAVKNIKLISTTHNMSYTPTWQTWVCMKDRIFNKNYSQFKIYNNKKITICERWLEFENFLEDMGERPVGKTLDRIDNSKGYYKENCRWATAKEQANNRDNNIIIEFNGEIKSLIEWAIIVGIKYSVLWRRLNYSKWSVYKSFTTPVGERFGK